MNKFIRIGLVLLAISIVFKRITDQYSWLQIGLLILSIGLLLYGGFKART